MMLALGVIVGYIVIGGATFEFLKGTPHDVESSNYDKTAVPSEICAGVWPATVAIYSVIKLVPPVLWFPANAGRFLGRRLKALGDTERPRLPKAEVLPGKDR